MAGRLWRRLRRNRWSVVSVVLRVLFRAKNLLALVGIGAGLLSLSWSVGALGAGQFASTGVFALVGGAALYGALTSYLGRPLRGVALFLAALLLVGGGAYAAGVGPADSGDRHSLIQDAPADTANAPAGDRAPSQDDDPDGGSADVPAGFGGGCSGQ